MAMAGVGLARSDSSIRDDVQFELKWDPKIDFEHLSAGTA